MNGSAKNAYILTSVLILLSGTSAIGAPDVSAGWQKRTSVTITNGDLSALFRDNSASPKILSGIQSLFSTKGPGNFDAYDPSAEGASAGMNFEHIISGHRNSSNKFTPRHGRYDLFQLPEKNSVVLVRDRKDSPWDVSSSLTYRVTAPHYIDVEFRCKAHNPSLFAKRRWAIFFFANYMNDVKDVALNFLGIERAGGQEKWIAADAPKGHPDWNCGGTYRHVEAAPLEYDEDVDFRLNSWSYDYPRFTRPFYYGRAAQGMVFILMFNKTYSEDDQIRFSLFKFKVPRHPRPAWDFQYVVNKVEKDREYGFKGRLVWKQFASAVDCLGEYEKWQRKEASTEN
ncbi:MAG: hypothetical protein AMJ65_02625 [Phycisphaerae bacterium SG8_4]|nr:MAG: hypothetical protein AMJ65_02625 [Phycisphaerae bacterium SG8_4]